MATESPPADAVDAFERPQATLPNVNADEDDYDALITEYTPHDYGNPIDHGFGLLGTLNDSDDNGSHAESAYTRLQRGFNAKISGDDDEPYVLVEDVHTRFDWLHDDYPAHLVLKRKGWKAGRDVDPDRAGRDAGSEALINQLSEYNIQVMRYDEETGILAEEIDSNLRTPVSFQCWIQPQNTDLVQPSGDALVCQYGEGTRFKTQTTYANPQETLTRTVEIVTLAFKALGQSPPAWKTLNDASKKIWKGETYHRFDSEKMDTVVHRLGEAKTLLEYGGQGTVETAGKMRNGRHVEELVVSDRWEKLGFSGYGVDGDFELGMKVYRMDSTPADPRLREPKLEAFFASADGALPHVDKWPAIRQTLCQLVNTFATMAAITLGQLRADDFYKPRERELIEFNVPQGWRQAVKDANAARLDKLLDTVRAAQNATKLDLIWTIADRRGAKYATLAEVLGLSTDRIQEVVAELVDQGILVRVSMPRLICFDNEELRRTVMDELRGYYPEDTNAQAIQERAEQRRKNRERQRDHPETEAASDDDTGDDTDDVDDDADTSRDENHGTESVTADRDAEHADDGRMDEWLRVDLLDYCREDIGRYLVQGSLPASDVKVRVGSHDWLLVGQ